MALDDPAVILNFVTVMTLIVALAFGVKQTRDFERKRREDATMRVLEQFANEDFAVHILRIGMLEAPVDPAARATMDPKERIQAIAFAQQMETLGVLVADRIIEIDLVEKALGSFVTSAWEKTKPVILAIRAESGDLKTAEYFQWLAERIAEREAKMPKEGVYDTLRGWQA